MPYIPNDDRGERILTKDYFVLRYFYKDSKCTKTSTRFLGKYQKIIKYSFENPRTIVKLWLDDVASGTPFPAQGEGLDYAEFIEAGDAVLVSERIEENPEYNPKHWREEFERSLEAIRQAEAEGYRIY